MHAERTRIGALTDLREPAAAMAQARLPEQRRLLPVA
jgi:hypothetical protein